MNNKFNEFLNELSFQIEIILVFIGETWRFKVNTLVSKHSINLNTSKYPLIKITPKEIIFDNIKAIIADYVLGVKYNSNIYMHIFNDKGQLISDFSLTINQ
jgi:hypothetical protein